MELSGTTQPVRLAVSKGLEVAALLGVPEWWPSGNRTAVILAHDVGTDMNHPLLLRLQQQFASEGLLSIRFNFPFAERGKKRPDAPAILERCYKVAVQALLRNPEQAPAQLIYLGYGLGARVASQVIASGSKADALVCVAYPLHPAGKPSQQKADPLFRIICPILFVQGDRDAHCRVDRLEDLRRRIGAPTRLSVIRDADHALDPIRRSARTPEDLTSEVLASVATFLKATTG